MVDTPDVFPVVDGAVESPHPELSAVSKASAVVPTWTYSPCRGPSSADMASTSPVRSLMVVVDPVPPPGSHEKTFHYLHR